MFSPSGRAPRWVMFGRERSLRLGVFVALLLGVHALEVGAACPQVATFVSAARGTTVDLGWTGTGHGLDLGSLRFTVGLGPCALRSDGTCGTCPITGLVDDRAERRCSGDAARFCRGDADCAEAGTCQVFLRSPVAVAAGGVGWCLLPVLDNRVHGSIEATEGSVTLDVPLTLQTYEGALSAPCPLCVGDTVAADGVRGGTCDGGPHAKDACDAGGADAVKGMGTPSLDCPPAEAATFGMLTEGARSLSLTTGTQTRTLDSASPTAKTFGHTGDRALCDICANDSTRACASSADCSDGACGGVRGAPTAPNACDDGVCAAPDGIHGACPNGPFDRACAAEPWRSCLADPDCPVAKDHCQVSLRKCFPGGGKLGDAVSARGSAELPSAGKTRSTLVALFCVPPGRNATTNQLFGLPGLGRVLLPGTWTLRTQSVEVLP